MSGDSHRRGGPAAVNEPGLATREAGLGGSMGDLCLWHSLRSCCRSWSRIPIRTGDAVAPVQAALRRAAHIPMEYSSEWAIVSSNPEYS